MLSFVIWLNYLPPASGRQFPGAIWCTLWDMSPMVAALLAASLVAAEAPPASGAGASDEFVAQIVPRDAVLGAFPAEQLEDVVLEALPPPPDQVKRVTRYYGT